MKEIKAILKSFEAAERLGKKTALATVVHVEGSSYRRPGARMLVTEDGQLTGAISGGCLEGDALRKALSAIVQQENKLVTYDTTDEDDARFGIQLGCNGIVHILFEPIHSSNTGPIHLLRMLLNDRVNAVLATLFSFDAVYQPGTSLLYYNGSAHGSLNGPLRKAIEAAAQRSLDRRASELLRFEMDGHVHEVFMEYVELPVALVVAGAGNDVLPLAEMASVLGWHTTIADGRPAQATPLRFGKADQVLVSKPDALLEKLIIDEHTFFVLMTHNYNYDLELLGQLIFQKCAYIGVLGPKRKLQRMLDDLREIGIVPDKEQLALIHGPVGLDIGAETPEEIALSIVAEINMVLRKRNGAPLRNKLQSIHSPLSN